MADTVRAGKLKASPAFDWPDATVANVTPLIADLAQSAVRRFDPLRFQVIEAMARKALAQRAAVRAILERKALLALSEYRADFLQAQAEAAATVDRLLERFPDASETVRALFASGDFRAVKRLQLRLNREAAPDPAGDRQSALAALTQAIKQASSAAAGRNRRPSLGELLQQQENAVLQSAGLARSQAPARPPATADDQDVEDSGDDNAAWMAASSAMRQLRETLVKRAYDRLASRAISAGPEAPGPLNPQALVIRSLVALCELSPAYLNRFLCYADTLLWLEQAGEGDKAARHGSRSNKYPST